MEENQSEVLPEAAQDVDEYDIFLFTNGEKQSPPRKHHISTNELRSWDDALQFLAQSQFGSEPQTMELYTTSGCKVEDPAQIQNFGAYVAVKPEENFIDAGYDKYLIKATRSRERRQSKRNSIEPVEPDSSDIKTQSPIECVKDTVNVQTADHDLAIETVFSHRMFETHVSKNNSVLKISVTKDSTSTPVESRKSSLKPDITPAPLSDVRKSPPHQVSSHPDGSQKTPQLPPSDPPLTPTTRRKNSPIRSTVLSRNRNAYNANVLSIKNQPKTPEKRTRKFTKVCKKVDDRNTSYLGMRHSNITDSSSSIVSTRNKTKLPLRTEVNEPSVTSSKKISSKHKLKNVRDNNSCTSKTMKKKSTSEILSQKTATKEDTLSDFPHLDDLIINKDLIVFAAVRPKRPESITPATDTSFGTEPNYDDSQEDIETTRTCYAMKSIEQDKKKQRKEKDRNQLVTKSDKIKQVNATSKFQQKDLHPDKNIQQSAIYDDEYFKKQLLAHTDEFLNSDKYSLLRDKSKPATTKHRELKSNSKTQECQIENRRQQVKKALLKELERSPEPLNMKNKKCDDHVMRPTTKEHPKTPFKTQTIKPSLKTHILPDKKGTMSPGKPKEPKPHSQTAPLVSKKSNPSTCTLKPSTDKKQSSSIRCETTTSARIRPFTPAVTPTPPQNKIKFEKDTKMSDKNKHLNIEPKTETKTKNVSQNRPHDPNRKISFYKQPKYKHDMPLDNNLQADNFGKFQLSITIPTELNNDDNVDYQHQSKQEISAENYRQPTNYNTSSHKDPRQFKSPDDEWDSTEWHKIVTERRQSLPFQENLLNSTYQSNTITRGDNFRKTEEMDHENTIASQQMEPEITQGSGEEDINYDVESTTSFIEIFSDDQKQAETTKKRPLQNQTKSITITSDVMKKRQSELIALSTALENITSNTRVPKIIPDVLPILTGEIRPLNTFPSDHSSTPKFLKHQSLKPIPLVPENHVQPKTQNLQVFKPHTHTLDPYKSLVKSKSQTNKSLQSSSIPGIPVGASHQTSHYSPEIILTSHYSPEKFESLYNAKDNSKWNECKGDQSERKPLEHHLTDNMDMDYLQSLLNSAPVDKITFMEKVLKISASPLPMSGVELITEQKKELTLEYKVPQIQEQVSVMMDPTPLITININMERGTPSSSVMLSMRGAETANESSLIQDDTISADETGVEQQSIDLRRSNSDTAVIEKYKSKSKKNDNEMLTQSKSLQSMVNELPDHNCCQKFPKVVIVQCGCCNMGANDGVNHTCKMDSNVLNPKNQECYVVIPVSSLPYCECHKECQCSCHSSDKQTQNSESLAKIKAENPVKNTSVSMSPNGDGQNPNISSLCQVYIGNEQNGTKYQSVMDNETFTTEVVTLRRFLQNESHCEQFERRISFKPVDCADKCTQTDWSDVLLEIRGHPDGHYTFHLPPLELLRQYGLI